jgi:hypothetical protein
LTLQLSAEAWAALGCLAGIILLSAAVLWGAWRRGMRSQRRDAPAEKIEGPSFNRPWVKEDAQFAELARKADDLRAHRQEPPGEKDQRGNI